MSGKGLTPGSQMNRMVACSSSGWTSERCGFPFEVGSKSVEGTPRMFQESAPTREPKMVVTT